jgi:hypothetical protein
MFQILWGSAIVSRNVVIIYRPEFFENENIHVDYKPITRKPITKPTYFFPENILTESLHSEEHRSSLFKFFQKYFEDEKIEKCFRKYLVGVDKNREDAVIFWQVDREKKFAPERL